MRNRHDRDIVPTATTTGGGQLVLGERLAQFRRIYRWLNLTLIQQGVWPLLLLTTSASGEKPQEVEMPWYLARLGAPAGAALLAFLYARRQPDPGEGRAARISVPGGRPGVAVQVKVALFALTLLLAAARLAEGPIEPASKLILFGLADVLAFQLIHFEVVRRSERDPAHGIGLAVFLFALSWGIRDLLLTALGPDEASPVLALVTGTLIGVVVALASRAVRVWPGGFWSAVATQFLVIYLVIGFID